MKEKVLYLGYVVSPEEANAFSGISVAGNKMQWNVVRCLSAYEDVDIECITVTPRAAFPKDKGLFQRKQKRTLGEGIPCLNVGYCNLPVLKQLLQARAVYRAAKKILKRNPTATLLSFNAFYQIGQPMRKLKKRFPQSKAVCLLADLPIDDKTDRRGISKLLRGRFDKNAKKNLQCYDGYIVLNKQVAKTYLSEKPYLVVDGGVDENDMKRSVACAPYAPAEKNILYCGALTDYNGIPCLLKAMEAFQNTEIFCDIYGGGHLEEEVRAAAQANRNLRYHGRVDNTTVMQKQREAWLLINPRRVDDPIAQVTFPSKTFEYMLSGTHVLSTRLNGYSEEYEGKLFFTGDTVEELRESIAALSSMDEEALRARGENALTFVVEKRTWKVQTERIYQFLKRNEER